MELFGDLPGPLKNIIIKQSSSCDALTNDGKECGQKFMYSVSDYFFSEKKEDLKKVMVNCTKFCLKHLSDLIINGELLLGYETKEEKNVIPLIKEYVKLGGDNFLVFRFNEKGVMDEIEFQFEVEFVRKVTSFEDIKEFKQKMIKNEVGYPKKTVSIKDEDTELLVTFKKGLISKPWRKFIRDCFKYKDSDQIGFQVEALTNNKKIVDKLRSSKIDNMKLFLGNLNSIEVVDTDSYRDIYSFVGISEIDK